MITITLDLPPSVNNMYTAGHGGQRRLTDKARTYKETATLLARVAAQQAAWGDTPAARYSATLTLYFDDRRKRDLDNTAKAPLDSVAAALGFDDAQIDRLLLIRAYDKTRPRCEIVVEVLK